MVERATVTTPRVGRREFGLSAEPIRPANLAHNGSTKGDAGSKGTDSLGHHQGFSNPTITCGSVPLPATTRCHLLCRTL
jgi:hypothetical protein